MEGLWFEGITEFKELFASWWAFYYPEAQKFNLDLLSSHGVVATLKGQPVALQYLYNVEDSPIVWIGYTIRDPSLAAYTAGKAIKMLFETSENAIKRTGRHYAFCTFESPALQKVAERRGYHGASTKEYWRNVWAV